MKDSIAERNLSCCVKGSDARIELTIRIGKPFPVTDGMVNFKVEGSFFGCSIDVIGIEEKHPDVFGADSMQAVNIASNIEPFLRRLKNKYDLYWLSGEPYFE